MTDVASPHTTRPVRVLITEPVDTDNRGAIARWLEDHGIGVLAHTARRDDDWTVFSVYAGPADDHPTDVNLGDRIVLHGRIATVADHAHYTLWYEPVEDTP